MRRKEKPMKLYIGKVLNEIWQILGITCMAVALGAMYYP